MSSVVLSGDTSGSVTLTVPAIAGSNTVTVPAGTGTMAVQGVSTNIVSGTAVASTSGTSIDFTSIPSWVKRITVMFNGVSTNGSSNLQIQIGAGSVATSGYVSGSGGAPTGNTITGATATSGYLLTSFNNSSIAIYGICQIDLIGANTWIESGTLNSPSGTSMWTNSGGIALSGTLDRVRITTVSGTNTFTAGSINILYE
jgi:hypothetical protein